MKRDNFLENHKYLDANDSSTPITMRRKMQTSNQLSVTNERHQRHFPPRNLHHRSFQTILPGLRLILVVVMTGLVTMVDGVLAKTSDAQPTTIKIACLLPANPSYLFSLNRMRPAIEIAVDKVTNNETGQLPGRKIDVQYADTMCNDGYAMHNAIEVYINQKPLAYFGPVCDYAMAPVARQARYWNIPVISQSLATTFALEKLSVYPTLTRVGASYNKLTEMFYAILKHFNWTRIKMIYDPNGLSDVMSNFCHVCIDGMQPGLSGLMNTVMPYYKFDTMEEALSNLKEEIGLDNGATCYGIPSIVLKEA